MLLLGLEHSWGDCLPSDHSNDVDSTNRAYFWYEDSEQITVLPSILNLRTGLNIGNALLLLLEVDYWLVDTICSSAPWFMFWSFNWAVLTQCGFLRSPSEKIENSFTGLALIWRLPFI
jgi:hypothetical protein